MKFSIIIPTYGRTLEIIDNTISSILERNDEIQDCIEIFLIDQNQPMLDIKSLFKKPLYNNLGTYIHHNRGDLHPISPLNNKIALVHISGGPPSTTIAKNYALNLCKGEYLIFFDDDVIVQKNCIRNHLQTFKLQENIGLVGGREIVFPQELKRNKLRTIMLKCLEYLSKKSQDDDDYKVNNQYIGRIKSNSFMISNFDTPTDQIIKVDGVRGCNWSTSMKNIKAAGFFDEAFQGTALREETDLFLRIRNLGKMNYYCGTAVAHHMRQLGGCNNLSQSFVALKSKYTNELYFQRKHFFEQSSFYFFIRTLPLALENISATYGISLLLHCKTYLSFFFRRKNLPR